MPIYKIDNRKDGKQGYRVIFNYTDASGTKRRKSKCVYGMQEAKEVETQLRSELNHPVNKRMTVEDLYNEYVKEKEYNVRTSSLLKTKSILKNHVLNTFLASVKIDRLSKTVLQLWKQGLAEKDIMISTKNNAIRELNILINYAVKMDYISKNYLKEIGKIRDAYSKVKQDKIQYYTKKEFEKYISAAKETIKTWTDEACYVFFYLAFYSGMRKGELNALKWSDIHGNLVDIKRSINQKVPGYQETPPKNQSSGRTITLPNNAMDVLKEHKKLMEINFPFSDDLRVCGGAKPISDTALENHNRKYAELAGLRHIRIHDFRHSHASLLINSGIDIVTVRDRLGHTDIQTTVNTYRHLYPKSEEKIMKVLES